MIKKIFKIKNSVKCHDCNCDLIFCIECSTNHHVDSFEIDHEDNKREIIYQATIKNNFKVLEK